MSREEFAHWEEMKFQSDAQRYAHFAMLQAKRAKEEKIHDFDQEFSLASNALRLNLDWGAKGDQRSGSNFCGVIGYDHRWNPTMKREIKKSF